MTLNSGCMKTMWYTLRLVGLLLMALSAIPISASSQTTQTSVEQAIALLTNDVNDVKGECCQNSGRGHVEITEKDINSLRIEFIKAQILRKLKMKETPQVGDPLGELPVQLRLSAAKPTPPVVHQVKEEDMFATTNQVMLLANPGATSSCDQDERPSNCFSFTLPQDISAAEVNSTELWIYKQHDIMDNDINTNQTFIYYEIIDGVETEIRRHSTRVEEGWIKLNVNKDMKRWLDRKVVEATVKVSCLTCGFTKPYLPLTMDSGIRPLIIINFQDNIKKKRPKRNINCMSGVTECCREKLYVDFKSIGWDDWVLEPRGYHAFFCKGSCSGATSTTLASTVHNTILRKLSGHKKIGQVPCCVATEHSPITLIYRHDNHTVTRTTLHNMVVESCGCM